MKKPTDTDREEKIKSTDKERKNPTDIEEKTY